LEGVLVAGEDANHRGEIRSRPEAVAKGLSSADRAAPGDALPESRVVDPDGSFERKGAGIPEAPSLAVFLDRELALGELLEPADDKAPGLATQPGLASAGLGALGRYHRTVCKCRI
jgi:hypothetical protein